LHVNSRSEEDFEQAIVVPSGDESLVLDSDFGRAVVLSMLKAVRRSR
jgi:hypothetical protein